MRVFESKLYKIGLLVFSVLATGTVGYILLSGISFIDAIYQTVITVTTVGFAEVHPFSEVEKIFTIFLILTSITIFGYAISSFSEYLVSGKLFNYFKHKKVKKKIDNLNGHTIICGFGRNGKQAMAKLKSYQRELVVIEKDKNLIEQLDLENTLNVEGDGTLDEILIKSGVEKASNLITALPSDADNLFVVLSARQLNNNCKIISRATNESSYNKLKIAGADNVIMPDKLGGEHMASLVVTPDVIEFVDRLTLEGETTANLEEVSVDDLPEIYLNKTILDLDLRKQTGCNVIGIRNPNRDYIINPDANSKLIKGAHLIVLGRPEQIKKLRELF